MTPPLPLLITLCILSITDQTPPPNISCTVWHSEWSVITWTWFLQVDNYKRHFLVTNFAIVKLEYRYRKFIEWSGRRSLPCNVSFAVCMLLTECRLEGISKTASLFEHHLNIRVKALTSLEQSLTIAMTRQPFTRKLCRGCGIHADASWVWTDTVAFFACNLASFLTSKSRHKFVCKRNENKYCAHATIFPQDCNVYLACPREITYRQDIRK